MIEKDGVVSVRVEQRDGPLRFNRDVELITREALCKPFVSALVVIEQKYAQGRAGRGRLLPPQPEFL